MTQTQIADALGITYDGRLMDALECFTDRHVTGSTIALPLGADLDAVQTRLLAMRETFADKRRVGGEVIENKSQL